MASEQRAPYRDQHRPDRARRVRYDALRPETRARLAAAAHGAGAWCRRGEGEVPAGSRARRLLLAALVTVLGMFMAAQQGSLAAIDLADPQAQSTRLAIAALLLQAIGLLAGVEVWAARKVAGRPLERGVYLLARELVDARAHDLVLHDTEGLAGVRARGAQLVLTFRDGARFAVDAAGLDPDALAAEIDERRAAALRAEADGDVDEAARLDPFAAERADWALSGGSGHARLRRLAPLAAGAVGGPAAMLLVALTAGRAVAIEQAVHREDTDTLIWFAQTDRWMSRWAGWRWAALALTPGQQKLHESYLLFGPDRGGFVRRLEAQTGDCSRLSRSGCAAAVQALCESRLHDPAALERALTRLDLRTTRDLGLRCQRVFEHHGWTPQSLSARQLDRAVAEQDVAALWEFPPTQRQPVIERLYDRGREQLAARRDTPTRRALDAVLAHLRERDVELGFRVVVPPDRSADEQTTSTQALMHHLGRQPFGQLLRLASQPRRPQEPREILALAPTEPLDALRPGVRHGQATGDLAAMRLSRTVYTSEFVWDEAWLEAHLVTRATPRHETEVTAVRWVFSTRSLPTREQLAPPPGVPWESTTIEAPLEPPVRWADATTLDSDRRTTLLDRLL